jgi:hypothetical protein
MFRSRRRDVVFPQMEHAAFAAGIALHWQERPNVPFDSFIRGVALHDRGYGELDEDAIGAVEPTRWLEMQRRGFGVHDDDPIVDLIVSLHVARLVGDGDPSFRDGLPALLQRANIGEATAAAADRITNLCDRISFDVCLEQPEEGSLDDITYAYDGGTRVTVDPWPFASNGFGVLLVGYRADGYPRTLDRVVEPITFAPELDFLERRVVQHQPALGAVLREPHRHDAARFDPRDDAFAEGPVPHAVAGLKRRDVVARRDLALPRRAVVRPRRRLQPLALDVLLG